MNNYSENRNCKICGELYKSSWLSNGFSNLWAQELVKSRSYRFARCDVCQYCENLDFEDIDFASEGYSNSTLSLEADNREKTLASKIFALSQDFFDKFSLLSCYIEIGSGKRLGFLQQLKQLNASTFICAIDPTYVHDRAPTFQENRVKLLKSVAYLNLPDGYGCSLIFRNSLEYHSPEMLKEIFQKLFINGGMISFELTEINLLVQGFSHSYTECRCFYTIDNVIQLLEDSGLHVIPVETIHLHGDGRILSIAYVRTQKQSKNIKCFRTLQSLVKYLDMLLASQAAENVMLGLGGRNIMALVNDLNGRAGFIYESDPGRRTVKLPPEVKIINKADIDQSMNIIVLNSRFLLQAQNLFPDNLILVLQ